VLRVLGLPQAFELRMKDGVKLSYKYCTRVHVQAEYNNIVWLRCWGQMHGSGAPTNVEHCQVPSHFLMQFMSHHDRQ